MRCGDLIKCSRCHKKIDVCDKKCSHCGLNITLDVYFHRKGLSRLKSRSRMSGTPGSTKGLHCQATLMERYFARKSRSYKNAGYITWSKSHK